MNPLLRTSVLGKLYGFWLCSAIFSLLRAIYRPFSRAFHHSAIVRFLARAPRFEVYYACSATGRVIDFVWRRLVGVFSRLMNALRTPARTSLLVRAASGSHICSFEFLLCAFIFVMFCAPHDYWSNSYAVLAVFGLFGIYLLLAAAGKREAPSPRALGLPFLLFVLSCFISLIFTTDMADRLRILMFFLAAFVLAYMVSAELSTVARLRSLMRWLYAAVMVTAAYAVVQRIMGVEVNASLTDLALNEGVPGRVYSTLDNSNNYAEFLVLFTPLCAAWAINLKDVRARFVFSCALALPMLALIMTYSRSGWLSFMLAVLVFVYYTDKRLIPVGFVACLLLIPFLPDSIVTRFLTIFNSADSSASYRIIVWRGVLLMLCDYGLTGIGLGPYTFDNVYPAYAITEKAALVAHSQMLYLELFLEWGALGFIGFMWLMLRHVKDSAFAITRERDKSLRLGLTATLSGFCGIAVLSVFEYIWYYPRILFAFFILLGAALGLMRAAKAGNKLKGDADAR